MNLHHEGKSRKTSWSLGKFFAKLLASQEKRLRFPLRKGRWPQTCWQSQRTRWSSRQRWRTWRTRSTSMRRWRTRWTWWTSMAQLKKTILGPDTHKLMRNMFLPVALMWKQYTATQDTHLSKHRFFTQTSCTLQQISKRRQVRAKANNGAGWDRLGLAALSRTKERDNFPTIVSSGGVENQICRTPTRYACLQCKILIFP